MRNDRIGIFLLIVISMSCITQFKVRAMDNDEYINSIRAEFEEIEYPYKAESDRVLKMKKNSNQLKPRMLEDDVIAILGEPDLISPVYNTVKSGRVIGSYYFYLFSQDMKNGSQKDMNQKSITVYFDPEGKVSHAVGKGVDCFKDIKKLENHEERKK